MAPSTESLMAMANARKRAVGERVLKAVKPVFTWHATRDYPTHVGTATFLRYRARTILVTARHVLEVTRNHGFYVGVHELIPIGGTFSRTNYGESSKGDRYDFAFLDVTDHEVLKTVEPVPEPVISREKPAARQSLIAVYGYPVSLNKTAVRVSTRSTQTKLWAHLCHNVLEHTPAARAPQWIDENHLLLPFEKRQRMIDGTVSTAISPTGISGGLAVDLASVASFAAFQASIPRALAIMTTWDERNRVLVGTWLAMVMSTIQKHFDSVDRK